MIVPRSRLLYWTGALLPLSILAAALPNTTTICIVIGIVAFLIAISDAFVSRNLLNGIHFQLPEIVRLSKDREGELPIQIENDGEREKVLQLAFPFPPQIESEQRELRLVLPDGNRYSRSSWSITPRHRGKVVLERCYFETPSRLGLWNVRSRSNIHSELRTYPNLIEERKKVAALFLNRGDFGIHSHRMVGQGREFEKLREYIPGDDYDQVHWKATAKRGKPITKIYQIERTQEVYVVIDYSRLSAKMLRDETVLEHYLRAALVLGLVAQKQGDLFGLITFADKVTRFLRASSGKAHFHACRDALYMLEPQIVTPDFEELCSLIRLRLRRRALLVFLTDLQDPILAESFVHSSALISKQHLILVNMVKPPAVQQLFSDSGVNAVDQLYENLSGHLQWQNLRELRKVLHQQGATFYQMNDAKMSAELVTQYLNVKQRQVL